MARAYFIVYFSSRRVLQKLDDVRRGRVILALLDYAEKGTEPQGLDDSESIAFESLRTGIDGDRSRYEERCRTNRASGRKGGRPSGKAENQSVYQKPNGFSKTQDKDKGKGEDEGKYNDSSYRRRHTARGGAERTTTTTAAGEQALDFWAGNVGPVGSYLRREVSDALCAATGADGVQCVGGTFVLYRRSPKLEARRQEAARRAKAAKKVNPVRAGVQARRKRAQEAREKRNEYFRQAAIEAARQRKP